MTLLAIEIDPCAGLSRSVSVMEALSTSADGFALRPVVWSTSVSFASTEIGTVSSSFTSFVSAAGVGASLTWVTVIVETTSLLTRPATSLME